MSHTYPVSPAESLDYTPFSISITLPAYSPHVCTAFSVVNDEEIEGTEYFSLKLVHQSPSFIVNEEYLVIHIVDDDSGYFV